MSFEGETLFLVSYLIHFPHRFEMPCFYTVHSYIYMDLFLQDLLHSINLSFYPGFCTTLRIIFYLQPSLVPGRLSPTLFLLYHLFSALSWPPSHVISKLYNHFVKCPQNSLTGALTKIVLYFNLVRIDSFTDFQKSSIYISKSSKVFSCSLLFLDTGHISLATIKASLLHHHLCN